MSHGRRNVPAMLTAALLLVAIVEVGLLWSLEHGAPAGRVYTALLDETGPGAHQLGEPGGTRLAADARLSQVGAMLTVEDVARGLLLLTDEDHPQALTAAQRRELAPLVRRAHEARMELLGEHAEVQRLDGELQELGRTMMAALEPEELEQITQDRDTISIAGVENRYWDQLLGQLDDGVAP